MRKHGRRSSGSQFWLRLVGGSISRRRTQVSFESSRQSCLWQTGKSRAVVIKH